MAFQVQVMNRLRGDRMVGNDYVIVRVDGGRSAVLAHFGSNESARREAFALANALANGAAS